MSADNDGRAEPVQHSALALASVKRAITRLDEALAEIEDARCSPYTADRIASEAMDEAYRRSSEALRWAQTARVRIEAAGHGVLAEGMRRAVGK